MPLGEEFYEFMHVFTRLTFERCHAVWMTMGMISFSASKAPFKRKIISSCRGSFEHTPAGFSLLQKKEKKLKKTRDYTKKKNIYLRLLFLFTRFFFTFPCNSSNFSLDIY